MRNGHSLYLLFILSNFTTLTMKNSTYLWMGAVGIALIIALSIFLSQSPAATTPTAETATTTDSQGTSTTGGNSGTVVNDHSAPIVKTIGFASVSSTTAAVIGTVIPGDASTTYWFEYGTTLAFGSKAQASASQATNDEIGTSGNITGLTPNTQYYFRAGAKNAYGTVYSGVYSFITLPR